MYANKPIIGLAGGIASGKSHVARLFGELGCMVISSDALVHTAYSHPQVKRAVMDMFGEEAFNPLGEVDRATVGRAVFGDVDKRRRLEALLHPIVNEVRLQRMRSGADDPAVVAYVWDSPLLFETNLDKLCNAVVFVDAPEAIREARARRERGWDEKELARREKVQMPLDKKRANADYVVLNAVELSEGSIRTRSEFTATPPSPAIGHTAVEVDGVSTDASRTGGSVDDHASVTATRAKPTPESDPRGANLKQSVPPCMSQVPRPSGDHGGSNIETCQGARCDRPGVRSETRYDEALAEAATTSAEGPATVTAAAIPATLSVKELVKEPVKEQVRAVLDVILGRPSGSPGCSGSETGGCGAGCHCVATESPAEFQ